jgi:hypothetical protein
MKKMVFFVAVLLVFSPALFSQEYLMGNYYSGTPSQGSTLITSLTGGNWDDGYYDVSLPSNNQFFFYGKKVTHLRIWTNGYVTFGFGSAPTDYLDYTPDPIPSTDDPNSYAAPWWDDWDLSSRGSIYIYQGTTWFNIHWIDIPHHSDATASYDFSMLLGAPNNSTHPNEILFYYGDVDSGTGTYDRAVQGTIGIEHYTGTQCQKYSYLTALIQNGSKIRMTPYMAIYDTTNFWPNAPATDNDPDIFIYRPGNGMWYGRSNDGTHEYSMQWGTLGDTPLPGDYDGDGDADELVVRPGSYYLWFGNLPTFTVVWGIDGDIPMAADFNGDGTTDLCVFRPSYGIWYINYRTLATDTSFQWGTPGDVPIPADYDGDGNADAAVYRPSTNMVYIRRSSNPGSPWIWPFGQNGDIPLPFNNTSTQIYVGLYRPSTGQWFLLAPSTGTVYSIGTWGLESDVPIPNDWNGGGVTDKAIWRPTTGLWYILGYSAFPYGQIGDVPRCRRSYAIVLPAPAGNTSDMESR